MWHNGFWDILIGLMARFAISLILGGAILIAGDCSARKEVNLDKELQYESYTRGSVTIHVLRISPSAFRFEYHASKDPLTPSQWQKLTNSVAVINAGMYGDNFIHVGEVVYKGNRMPSITMKNYQGVFAFDPVRDNMPEAVVFDLNCTPLSYIKHNYRSRIQNMRFTSCMKDEQLWGRWNQSHPMSVLGQDSQGNILFIFTPSELSPRKLRDMLKKIDVGLTNSVYLEGGKEAGMFIKHNGFEFEGVSRGKPFPIPNVIVVQKRED